MVKTKIKKMSMFALAAIMSVGMMTGMFNISKVNAATNPARNQAQITVGKTLTINGTKWPNISSFTFKLEPISGYTNPDTSTSVDGHIVDKNHVPMPNYPDGMSGNNPYVEKTVTGFDKNASGITQTKEDSFDNIRYSTAGYYLYKLTEVIPNPKVRGVEYDESNYYVVVYVVNDIVETGDNKGDTKDTVHVESITAWHNDDVTSPEYRPNLRDIAEGGKTHNHVSNDFNTSEADNNLGDNNRQTSKPNETYGNGQTTTSDPAAFQRWDDLGKVGVSKPKEGYDNPNDTTNYDPNNDNNPDNPDGRNQLKAYKFWNRQEMHDITITKNVKGNLGDINKDFEFEIELTNLEAGEEYGIEKNDKVTLPNNFDTNDTRNPKIGGFGDGNTTIRAASSGGDKEKATFLVKMKDNGQITIKNLPKGTTYKVTERASNHVPSYTVTSSNPEGVYEPVIGSTAKNDTSGEKYYKKNSDSTYTEITSAEKAALTSENTVYKKTLPVITSTSEAGQVNVENSEKEVSLSTAVETVDASDGNVTIAYTNTRNLETITGVPDMAIYFGIAGIIAVIAFLAIRRRKDNGLAEM